MKSNYTSRTKLNLTESTRISVPLSSLNIKSVNKKPSYR